MVDKRYLSKHKHDDAGQIATKQNGKPRRRMTGASCSATPRSSRGRNCIARSLRIWCLKSNRGEKKIRKKEGLPGGLRGSKAGGETAGWCLEGVLDIWLELDGTARSWKHGGSCVRKMLTLGLGKSWGWVCLRPGNERSRNVF